MPEVTEKRFEFQDAREMVAVLGETDEYLKEMQQSLGCRLIPRGNQLIVQGTLQDVELAERLVRELLFLYRQGMPITQHDVKYSLRLVREGQEEIPCLLSISMAWAKPRPAGRRCSACWGRSQAASVPISSV